MCPARDWYTGSVRTAPDPRLGNKSVGLNVFEDDRPCGSCGYNLKGLAAGGVCPECGTPIRPKAGTSEIAPELLEAPRALVTTIGYGCIGLAALTLLEIVVGIAMAWGRASALWTGAIGLCFGLAWVAGVVLVTIARPGAPRDGAGAWLELVIRWAARGMSLLVPAGFMCLVVAEVLKQRLLLSGNWELIAPYVGFGGKLSYVPLALAVANLALSGAEDAVAWRTRAGALLMVVTFAVSGLALWMTTLGAVGAGAGIFMVIAAVAWMVAWILTLLGLTQAGLMMLWSVKYVDESADREKRRIEREIRDRERFKVPAASPIGPYMGAGKSVRTSSGAKPVVRVDAAAPIPRRKSEERGGGLGPA